MTMVDKLSALLGITFVLSTLLSEASGVDTVIWHFHMAQKHPELKECASTMLQENECVAVCISQLTGQCESLPHSWGKDEIMESGYDYAKKIFVQKNFQAPRQVGLRKTVYWMIPRVFKTGEKLDSFILFPPTFQGFLDYRIEAYEGSKESNGKSEYSNNWPVKSGTKQMVKMSWLAKTDSVVVFANDVELLTYRLKVHLDIMRQIFFYHETNCLQSPLTASSSLHSTLGIYINGHHIQQSADWMWIY